MSDKLHPEYSNAGDPTASAVAVDSRKSEYLKRTHFDGASTGTGFQLKLVDLSTSHVVNAQGVPVQIISGRVAHRFAVGLGKLSPHLGEVSHWSK